MIKEYAIHQFILQMGGSHSADNQYFSPQVLSPVIELGKSTPKPVHLSQWFQNQFESSWQSVELLFEESTQSAAMLRSAYHLRAETFIKRFKSVKLGNADSSITVALLIAVSQTEYQTYQICAQVQPARQATALPEGIKLSLLDEKTSVLAEIEAQARDSFIQLPYFRGTTEEIFKLELAMGKVSHTEVFLI